MRAGVKVLNLTEAWLLLWGDASKTEGEGFYREGPWRFEIVRACFRDHLGGPFNNPKAFGLARRDVNALLAYLKSGEVRTLLSPSDGEGRLTPGLSVEAMKGKRLFASKVAAVLMGRNTAREWVQRRWVALKSTGALPFPGYRELGLKPEDFEGKFAAPDVATQLLGADAVLSANANWVLPDCIKFLKAHFKSAFQISERQLKGLMVKVDAAHAVLAERYEKIKAVPAAEVVLDDFDVVVAGYADLRRALAALEDKHYTPPEATSALLNTVRPRVEGVLEHQGIVDVANAAGGG